MTIIVLLTFASCGTGKRTAEASVGDSAETALTYGKDAAAGTEIQSSNESQAVQEQETTGIKAGESGGSNDDINDKKTELLQSAGVDLDADGINEQVEAVMTSTPAEGQDSPEMLEGTLVIKDDGVERKIPFQNREQGLTGLITSMQFEDLDNDGSKDVFIIIPGNGASYTNSTYFAYSYKKDKSFSFVFDNTLIDYIAGFKAAYIKGGNKLTITNLNYGFEADLSIENGGQPVDRETMQEYADQTWIDANVIDISDDSRLSLVRSPEGRMEIKVPLPVFGLAAVDMIGEIESYYTLDENMQPVLRHFEIWDFKNANHTERVKVGSCIVLK